MNKNNLFSHLYIIIGFSLLTVTIISGQFLSIYKYSISLSGVYNVWNIYPVFVWIPPLALIFLGFRERFYSKNK
ncbi:hypothetical protein [Paramaledivibacter caminithermalis]|uniref:Uncharacterized protein n=1 Tax=Paramaledivibacter caminithermalis (strain DSM 15212 / CIP 107654 / DViRD3) TaxID=1121301 RepID=A0A1M6T613_PARC5|nr:hypothetical protein [Paramaledivibacter caminithermalis]SHK52492.1 hypothetical protein SAMN02745912_03575 [Paramaledivibacter caminithermalis DSM 15212]